MLQIFLSCVKSVAAAFQLCKTESVAAAFQLCETESVAAAFSCIRD